MNREIVSGQKMTPRIGPLAKLDCFFTQKKIIGKILEKMDWWQMANGTYPKTSKSL